ncbi:MAG: endonuclease/exonuclease/phosphatase family protein [Planctomycetes bacterium]|nr:endonuclease/exonuclease/phosphatase family protein [Planctomycetota bacterium]
MDSDLLERRLAPLRPWLARAGWIGAAILVGWSLVGWSARWWWLGEICVNFTFQLACGGLAAALLLWLGGSTRAALACAALCAWHLWPVGRLYLPPPPLSAEVGATLRVAQANLLYHNTDTSRLLPWVERDDPDLLVLLEFSPRWREQVQRELEARYPHRLVTPDFADPWSPAVYALALYSKLPLARAEAVRIDARAQEFLDVELAHVDGPLRVLVLHPNRPGVAARTAMRNAVLAAAAERGPFGPRTLVLADMNATLWSPAYGDFIERSGLCSARAGFGRLATWRSDRYLEGLWLDLDHVLVGAGIEVQGLWRGPALGSDHLPLVARLALLRPPREP